MENGSNLIFLIHPVLHQVARKEIGKGTEPTVAIMDAQSIKTSELSHRRGFDDHT